MGIVKDFIRWIVWFPFRWFLLLLPFGAICGLGRMAGLMQSALYGTARRHIEAQMSLTFPDKSHKEIKRIARESFVNHMQNEFELLLFPTMNRQTIESIITIEGREHLDRALGECRGVILLISHFGANLLFIPAFGHMGYKFNQMSVPATEWENKVGRSFYFLRAVLKLRTRYVEELPVKHIPVTSTLKPAFKCLKANEILCIAGDGGAGVGEKVKVPFLGRFVYLPFGAFAIAARTKAVVLPAMMVRQPDCRHRMVILPPMAIEDGGGTKDYTQSVRNYAKILEKYIYEYPDHYGWMFYCAKTQESNDRYPFMTDN